MAEGPLIIILRMILLIIENGINTMLSLFGLLNQLLGSLFIVSVLGGTFGFLLAIVILVLAGFFLGKFFFSSVKTVILLIMAGFLVLVFILWGLSVV